MKNLLLVFCLLLTQLGISQKYDARIAPTNQPLTSVPIMVMPSLDNAALLAAEMQRRGPGIAPRFAHAMEVDIRPETHGQWEVIAGDIAVWRMRIRSANAHSLNFGFQSFFMPAGGSLIVYSPDRKHVMGPFSPADNEDHEQLWTPVFDSDEIVLEVQLPQSKRAQLKLHLSHVNHDFIGFSSMLSQDCNLDVICGAEDGWGIVDDYRDIIQSVAVYSTGGTTFCTGFLINNERNDCTPYFMTANHCGVGQNAAPSLVVFWNFENSECREPNTSVSGGPGDGTLADFNSGAKFRASYAPSDMTLLELDDPVSETADAFFAGWTISNTAPTDTLIAIHHPNTDEKRISFSFLDTYVGEWATDDTPVPDGDHLIVPDWAVGTTEGGSSGCPLFDKNKRVVGQLHGGFASCGNNEFDSFGWFAVSWEGGGTVSTRLKDWLDPDNTGITTLDGHTQEACNISITASLEVVEICAPTAVTLEVIISPNFTSQVLLGTGNLPSGLTAIFAENPVMPGDTTTLTIDNTAAATPGEYTLLIAGTDGNNNSEIELTLLIANAVPTAPTLLNPPDMAAGLTPAPNFSWQSQLMGTTYQFQLATDDAFTNLLADENNLPENAFSGLSLETETTFYWRVRGTNQCGEGEWSPTFSFTTSSIYCTAQSGNDLPLTISENGTPTVISMIEVTLPGRVAGLQVVDLEIIHSWVGDLEATLVSPAGTEVLLFDRPGVPNDNFGCDGSNLLLSFNDNALLDSEALESSCEDNPAISGAFQPIQPLAAFNGELAAGTWTLYVTDNADEDGGSLQFWQLDFCNTVPAEASLTITEEIIERCFNEPISFEVILGSGFSTPTVNLSASGIPNEVEVAYSANPATAGEIVTVTLSGFPAGGDYMLNLQGSDGTLTASTSVNLSLLDIPDDPILVAPTDGATGVPLSVALNWDEVPGALTYNLIVATDPAFTNIVLEEILEMSSFGFSGLEQNTTYYWQVRTAGECGLSEGSAIQSFTTFLDLNFVANPQQVGACSIDHPSFTLAFGGGFNNPMFSMSTEPVSDLTATFTANPGNASEVIAQLENLTALTAGTYDLTFTITDEDANAKSFTVQLVLETIPGLPQLVSPASGTSLMETAPTLSWNPSSRATSYRVDWSASDNFMELIGSVTLNETSFVLDPPLEPGTYFWRVSALNNCGGVTAAAFHFTIAPNAIGVLQGRAINLAPNPTNGVFRIFLSEALPSNLSVEVFGINGQQLRALELPGGQSNLDVDLADYPAGVYLLRLTNAGASMTKRVIRQ